MPSLDRYRLTEVGLLRDAIAQFFNQVRGIQAHYKLIEVANNVADIWGESGHVEEGAKRRVANVDFAWGIGTANGIVVHLHCPDKESSIAAHSIAEEFGKTMPLCKLENDTGPSGSSPSIREWQYIFSYPNQQACCIYIRIWEWYRS